MLRAWKVLATLLLLIFCPLSMSDTISDEYWKHYETGALGPYPQVKYVSTKATSPLIHVAKWSEDCDVQSKVFISPHGNRVPDNKLYMLDHRGNLLWHHQEKGSIHNIQVQNYHGDNFITYWVGDDEIPGYGAGSGYIKMV
jgi:hypothetical protein